MTLIAGLDVSKADVVVCLIDTALPLPEPGKLYIESDFPRLKTDVQGLKTLLAMKPDACVLEPTGTNYSRFWCHKLKEAGIRLLLVSHSKVRRYRETILSENKDDEGDALALAYYGAQFEGQIGAFLRNRDPIAERLRELCHRLDHLNRMQSPQVNRIRQDLAWQCPELASKGLNAVVFWGWLAGERKSALYDKVAAETIGSGITDYTREMASLLIQLWPHEEKLTREMLDLLSDARFLPYRKVFARFGFGQKLEAILLSHIYPLSNFLGEDGLPMVVRTRSKKNPDKQTDKHLSERRFLKVLGCSPTREWSGKKQSGMKQSRLAGSGQVRTALWQWVFTRIETKQATPKNLPSTGWEIDGVRVEGTLKEYFEYLKGAKTNIKLARSRLCAKTVKALFRELVEAGVK
ncbi:MAG: transposase [Aphanocapsa sp. GSE-SYN-MK-11-07L]|jgi:hypothetical protein|nr:transposase [Aphanocapsa sp. GSE-SYN-MK-11-07L]